MQNIKNGQPVVFSHDCPDARKGKKMTKKERDFFREDMVCQCFKTAEINLVRLPKQQPSGFWNILFGKRFVSPVFRNEHFLSADETCDYIIADSVQEMEKISTYTSLDFECFYTKKDKRFLKVLAVKVENVVHPGELINGDRYTVEIFSRNVYPKQKNYSLPSILSDSDLIRKVAKAWEVLDSDCLKPFLDKDFHYKSDFVFTEISSRDEYLYYLRGKFRTIRNTNNNARTIGLMGEENNSLSGVLVKIEYMDTIAFIEVKCNCGRIVEMIMHECEGNPFAHEKTDAEKQEEEMKELFDFESTTFREFIRLEAAYRNQYVGIRRSTENDRITLGEVINCVFEEIERWSVSSMAVICHNALSDDSAEETILTNFDEIWKYDLFSCIQKGHVGSQEIEVSYYETTLVLKTSYRNIILTVKNIGTFENFAYYRVTLLSPDNSDTDDGHSFKDRDVDKTANAPFVMSFIISHHKVEDNSDLVFFDTLEQVVNQKIEGKEELDKIEEELMHGKFEFIPFAYPGYGNNLYEQNRYYDAYSQLMRAYNHLIEHEKNNSERSSLFYQVCTNIGKCLMKLERFDEASFFFKQGAPGLTFQQPNYLALCKAKMGNPFSIKEMDDWMKMIFHGQGKSWDLSEDVKEAQKEIPRSLVRYHRAMELYFQSSDRYDDKITIGFVLDRLLCIKQKNIMPGMSIYDLKNNSFLSRISDPQSVAQFILNREESQDKVFVLSCSHAGHIIHDEVDQSKLCLCTTVILSTHAIHVENGDSCMRVDIVRANFKYDDDKRSFISPNLPLNATFCLGVSDGWTFTTSKKDLSAAMSTADFLMRNCRFVESYQLAKWIFEYSLHRLKVRMGQEFFIYDPAVVSLLFDAAFCVGYSLMELNLMYAAYYYLEIASHSQDAEHIHEFINCLANTNDPQSLDVIEETLRNSPKPEDENYISAWNYHIAFLKRRKAYVLIERKMYVEAKQLLKEMIEEPLSRDFALNELRYLASMGF